MSFNDTSIRWTDKTWNPVHGCSKTSEGCQNCYAERVSRRFGNTDQPWTTENVEENIQVKPRYLHDRLDDPCWVFVNSMSDLYHEAIHEDFIQNAYEAIGDMPESAFQILSKHGPDGEREIPHPPDNVMLGVSVESPRRKYRLDWLRYQPAQTKFVSFEPLVEAISEVDLAGIDWAIIGGESGPDYREMDPEWARELIYTCWEQDVAVFFKQHSDRHTEANQTIKIGVEEMRIEEFPDLPSGIVEQPVSI